ncbi:MAG: GNAT family N-acetyltransferase [Syntrophomonadaceae bacterium]|jgi:hypothetical protein|nr:GNAT family N-acetyltransferase [Syntrophomonadaceae bacterium]MDH7497847.1 GNAT family N-acetyltransferase [Syntrophomonadaceae bacterium]
MQVRAYRETDREAWDALVARSWNGTFLHSRRFLSYHGDRFQDESLLLFDDEGRLQGVIPVAVDPRDSARLVSHPGLTYGGVVHAGGLRGMRMVEALHQVRDHFAGRGFARLLYKAVPLIYHRVPSADDSWALFLLGAQRCRCDLASVIDYGCEVPWARRARPHKARRLGVQVDEGAQYLPAMWVVMEAALQQRHGVRPVHTLEEILLLQAWFPGRIACVAGLLEGELVAGVVLFRTGRVMHAQYAAVSPEGMAARALPLVFEHCIAMGRQEQRRYFSFGHSNEGEGRILNQGLHAFKSKFGAGGVVHEFWELPLVSGPAESESGERPGEVGVLAGRSGTDVGTVPVDRTPHGS